MTRSSQLYCFTALITALCTMTILYTSVRTYKFYHSSPNHTIPSLKQPTHFSKADLPKITDADSINTHLQYWKYTPPVEEPIEPILWPEKNQWNTKRRYLSFERDLGGFNNIRLGFEAVVVMAHMTNRVLVMPPETTFYLTGAGSAMEQFYCIESLKKAVQIISYKQFLTEIGIIHNSSLYSKYEHWREFMRDPRVAYTPKWMMHAEVMSIPSILDCKRAGPENFPLYEDFAGRRRRIDMSADVLSRTIMHIRCDANAGYRYFGLFYTHFYFANAEWHRFYVGFIRNHLHYKEFLFELSAKIIAKLRAVQGSYIAVHIRRGDFQYKNTRMDIDKIIDHISPLLDRSVLYVSTDERDKTFFEPLKKLKSVYFLDDFMGELDGLSTKYYGMVEQIVCTGAYRFIGTELSTFSAHITRLRWFVSSELATDKNFYLTGIKYTGNPAVDTEMTDSTWMKDGRKRWQHDLYFREFPFFLEIENKTRQFYKNK